MPFQISPGSMLKRMLTAYDREEQGYPPNRNDSITESGTERDLTERRFTVAKTDAAALIPQDDKLLTFRSLTGIDTVPALTISGHSVRTAPNIGIYTRIVKAENRAKKRRSRFGFLINFCLGLQVIVAASLTALGAANGSHKAVTAFGAINTIIAGILTYLKGSGQPDRYKFHEEEWRRVREHIEQREREFCLADCNLDVQEEIQIVEEMYQGARSRLEGSHTPGYQNEMGNRHDERQNSTVSMPTPVRYPLRRSETMPTISQHENEKA